MDYLSQFIDPQYAILVAILYCVGSVIKRTEKVNCRWIPIDRKSTRLNSSH